MKKTSRDSRRVAQRRKRKQARLHFFEELERRDLLAVTFDELALLNDTGASNTDQVTSDPTLTGHLSGITGVSVDIEFDHNADGVADGSATVYSNGETFTYDPIQWDSSLATYEGPWTVQYRAVEYDSVGNSSSTAWNSFALTLEQEPEIDVIDDTTYLSLTTNASTVDFGSTSVGVPVTRTFLIENYGYGTLDIDVSGISVPSGFNLTSPPATSVTSYSSTSFTLQLDASSAGLHSGSVSIPNDDVNESPFVFFVEGTATSSGGVSFSTFGLLNDTGAASDLVTTDPTIQGDVQGITASHVDVEFDLDFDGAADGMVTVTAAATGFTFDPRSIDPSLSTHVGAWSMQYRAREYDGGGSLVSSDGWHSFAITLEAGSPEIAIENSGVGLTDGVSVIDFGSTSAGTPVQKSFTITNSGDGGLSIDPSSISMPPGFSLDTQPAASVGPGQTTSFQIGLTGFSAGSYSGTIAIGNNDADENPFEFTVQGVVTASGGNNPEIVVDHGGNVTSGQGLVDFGQAELGSAIQKTFVIQNIGVDPLLVDVANISLPTGFHVVSAPANSIQPGLTSNLTVALTAALPGDFSGQIEIPNNDTDEDPFVIPVQGSVDGVGVSISSLTVVEGGVARFVVELSERTPDTVVVDYTTQDGTANAGLDYSPRSGQLTFLPGDKRIAVPVPVLDDSMTEAAEDFSVILTNATNSAIVSGVGTGIISTIGDPGSEAPQPLPDHYQVSHDTLLTIAIDRGVLVNDHDRNGDPITASLVSGSSNGSTTLASDGSFTYQPNPGFVGEDQFTYQVSDGTNSSQPVSVTIDVQNREPTSYSDDYRTGVDAAIIVPAVDGVLRNDADLDGDSLVATVVAGVSHGTLTLSGDGGFTYTPTAGHIGTDEFTYTASDGINSGNVATVELTVSNAPPSGAADRYFVGHDTTLDTTGRGVLGNDRDRDGHSIQAVLGSGPVNGTLTTFLSTGEFVYVPNPGFVGTDTFTYSPADNWESGNDVTVTLHVTNDRPVGTADRYLLHGTGPFSIAALDGVLANDQDRDGDSLSATLLQATGGTIALSPDGGFDFFPDQNFTGTPTFSYVVSDGLEDSLPVDVALDVRNLAPIANPESYSLRPDAPLAVTAASGLLANDLDLDGDQLSIEVSLQPTNGVITVGSDGAFTYTPTTGFVGTDTAEYTVSDGAEAVSAIATFSIVNSAPWALSATYSTSHDTTLNVGVPGLAALAGDVDGDSLTFELVTDVATGALTFNSDGTFTYAPAAGWAGVDSFEYRPLDGYTPGAISVVTIDVVNADPNATPDTYATAHGRAVTGNLLDNDADQDGDGLTLAGVVTQPTHGTLTTNSDGSFTYTPTNGYVGADSWSYSVTDGVATVAAIATVEVSNAAPSGSGDLYHVLAGTTLIVAGGDGVLTNDDDPDADPLTATLVDSPSNGSLTFNADGTFGYTPDVGFIGRDSFSYQASDNLGALSATTSVEIVVVNENVVAFGDSFSASHDNPISGDVSLNDFALLSPIVYQVQTPPTNGVLNLNADGTFSFVPDAGFVGNTSFEYEILHNTNGVSSAAVTLEFTNSVPRAPVGSHRISHDTSLQLPDFTANIIDVDGDAVTASIGVNGEHGTASIDGAGALSYVPTPGFVGTDSFAVVVHDGIGTSPASTITIHVVNAAPIALADEFTVHHSTTITESVAGNDRDFDGDALVYSVVDAPAHGTLTLNANGDFTFQADLGYIGADSFTYSVTDGVASTSPVIVDLTIANTAPYAEGEEYRLLHDTVLSRSAVDGLLANDWDLDGDVLTVSPGTAPQNGTLTVLADGSFTYTPN